MSDLITLDGSEGEGGGQLLRTSLTLSLVTGRPFRMERIRAGREKPGLLRQHLTAVRAAADVGQAHVSGAELSSRTLTFEPSALRGGDYACAIGTAGSATLVSQTLLPALWSAREPSRLTVAGGTHNPWAPPYDFIERSFLPLVRKMGPVIRARLERHGFYPAGGGRLVFEVDPCASLQPHTVLARGATSVRAFALLASLPESIGKREMSVVRDRLGLDRAQCQVVSVDTSDGPGNAVVIVVEGESSVEVVTAFGTKGVTAEAVAAGACDEVEQYLRAGAPIGSHLADQLLVPMALAGGGEFRTLTPTMHTRTNAQVIERFINVSIVIDEEPSGAWRVTVRPR